MKKLLLFVACALLISGTALADCGEKSCASNNAEKKTACKSGKLRCTAKFRAECMAKCKAECKVELAECKAECKMELAKYKAECEMELAKCKAECEMMNAKCKTVCKKKALKQVK